MDAVGPSGETIMDYTVFDAIQSGFDQVVFVIREDFENEFLDQVAAKYKGKIKVDIVHQDIYGFVPQHLDISKRKKPWGTGHAVLSACSKIHKPFAVFNADDFYGRDAIQKIGHFLQNGVSPDHYAMVGYPLKNTLSGNGSVSRGICKVSDEGELIEIEEHEKIRQKGDDIVFGADGHTTLPGNALASMNLWGLHPAIFPILEYAFNQFIIQHYKEEKSELYLPFVINQRLKDGHANVQVLNTDSQWLGVTYKEDLQQVKEGMRTTVENGEYPTPLWPKN
jgi:NDP-sugar pyrophosphorylase family protein